MLHPLLLLLAFSPAPQQPGAPWAGLPEVAPPATAPVAGGFRVVAAPPATTGLRLWREQPPSLACPERRLYERLLDGYPVAGEVVRINRLRDGRTLVVESVSAVATWTGADLIGRGAAVAAARAAWSPRWPTTVDAARLEILPLAAGARLAWRVDLSTPATDAVAFRHWIDAATGAPLGTIDRAVHGQGTGYTFLPNPVQDLDDPGLRDQNNSATAVPAAAYHQVALLDLDGSGFLTGPWATTDATAGRTNRPNLDFSANRSKTVFEEVLGYYHVDSFQRRLQALGLNARRQRQRIDVHDLLFGIFEYPNASYNPANGVIAFGTLGVDFAEDADVVVHEYGHAIHHDVQGQLSSGNTQNGAMGEGYGDWFAAVAADDALVGEWVGTDWGPGGGFPLVRRVDGIKRYPTDWVGEVHEDGEIWSAALWELTQMIGPDTALTLVIEAMGMQTRITGFRDAASFLLLADQQLYAGAHQSYLRGPLLRSGLLAPGPAEAVLYASARALKANHSVTFVLDAPAYPGAPYQAVVSLGVGATPTGPPYNTTLDIDLGLLAWSQGVPGMSGTLDASGRASWAVPVPSGLAWKTPVFAQAMILDGLGASIRNTAPIAFRAERH
ncbi:MAG: hypothetical protein D6702_10025 [Planctomycetota bacterium]|nr:MAG: hypothetical protein D6702_10025 [Planctomycetota bacterium]